jgi:hypothetical protein
MTVLSRAKGFGFLVLNFGRKKTQPLSWVEKVSGALGINMAVICPVIAITEN